MIKHPMDFGTIKKKLNLNIYQKVEEFLKDMSLVFSNCQLYNGTETPVGRIGVQVRSEYVRLLGQYNFVERFQNSQQVHPSELFIQNLQKSKKENEDNKIEEEAQSSPVVSESQAQVIQPIQQESTPGGLEKIDEVRSTLERKGSENIPNKEKPEALVENPQVVSTQKPNPVMNTTTETSEPIQQTTISNQTPVDQPNQQPSMEVNAPAPAPVEVPAPTPETYQQPNPIPQIPQVEPENLKIEEEKPDLITEAPTQTPNQAPAPMETPQEPASPVKPEQETLAKPAENESEDSLMGAGTEGDLVRQTETTG